MKKLFSKPGKQTGNSNKGKSPSDKGGKYLKILYVLIIVGLLIFLVIEVTSAQSKPVIPTISYIEFKDQVRLGNVEKVSTSGNQIDVWLKEPLKPTDPTPTPRAFLPAGSLQLWKSANQASEPAHVRVIQTSIQDPALMPLLEEQKVAIDSSSPQQGSTWNQLFNLLVIIAFISIGFILIQRLSGPDKSESLGGMTKSPARTYSSELGRITFQDVAGSTHVKQELQEVIDYLKDPQRFSRLGAKIPKGVLLVGPPGTGKTLLARAVAGEAGVPFLSMSGSDFMEMYVGVGAARVRKLFSQAKKTAPTIIFIDELDSIGRRRSANGLPGNEERDQTLNQLLSEMDGFQPSENVIVMAATNRPEILDPAIQRPGRFDRQVVVDNPTLQDRIEILRIHARDKAMEPEVDLEEIARGTPGLSGADLANLLNEAALLTARKSKDGIGQSEINEARDKVLIGLERNVVLTEEDARLIAYHEAGHALVAALLPHADPVHKVTIIPRGMAMGVTQQLPERDRFIYSNDYLLDTITVMMGGRAAEEVALGLMTSGASNDLKQATHLARKMVLEWGMSTRFGAVFLAGEGGSFLGDDLGPARSYSESTAREVDDEIRNILEGASSFAKTLLVEHRQALDRLVQTLLEKEQIPGDEVYALLQEDDRR